MASFSHPFVSVCCERVISHDRHHHNLQDLHKPLIIFSINPNSTHSENYLFSTEPITTAISGPTIYSDLVGFLAGSDNHRSSGLMDMLLSLNVSLATKHGIVDKIVDGVIEWIASSGDTLEEGEKKFNVKVSITLHVSTFYSFPEYEDGDNGGDSNGMIPAAEEAIESLERVMIDEETRERQCSICLEDYYVGQSEVCRLECSHVFHGHCLRAWLETSHYCPLCRFPLPVRVQADNN